MAIRCNDCYTKVDYLGKDRVWGGTRIECPDCGKRWSMGRSMTGPEAHFLPLDEDGEVDEDGGSPIDTLNPNTLFYLSLIVVIAAAYFLR
jgi:DNA-directed RNA polymerase subunit RPC12/RpoP